MVRHPSVLQEYKDHGGVFFKVYVVDSLVRVYRRPSLPDLQALLRQQGASSHMRECGSECVSDSMSPSYSHCDDSCACACVGTGDAVGLKSILFDSRYAYPSKSSFYDCTPPVTPTPQVQPTPSLNSPLDLPPPNSVAHTTTVGGINTEPYVRTRKPSAADLSEPNPTTHQGKQFTLYSPLHCAHSLTHSLTHSHTHTHTHTHARTFINSLICA